MLTEIAQKTRLAAQHLASLSSDSKNDAIELIATSLEHHTDEIVAANLADCQASDGKIGSALYSRLKLDPTKLKGAIVGVRDVGRLADPVGQIQIHRELDTGLIMHRLSCPVGVLGVIFEARPDAVNCLAARRDGAPARLQSRRHQSAQSACRYRPEIGRASCRERV